MFNNRRQRTTGMPNGRPKKDVSKENLLNLYGEYQNWQEVARVLNMSSATIYRRIKELNIQKSVQFH